MPPLMADPSLSSAQRRRAWSTSPGLCRISDSNHNLCRSGWIYNKVSLAAWLQFGLDIDPLLSEEIEPLPPREPPPPGSPPRESPQSILILPPGSALTDPCQIDPPPASPLTEIPGVTMLADPDQMLVDPDPTPVDSEPMFVDPPPRWPTENTWPGNKS